MNDFQKLYSRVIDKPNYKILHSISLVIAFRHMSINKSWRNYSYYLSTFIFIMFSRCISYHYILIMKTDQFVVNCITSPTKTLISNRGNVELLSSLTYAVIENKVIISYYEGKTDIKPSQGMIAPIDCIQQENHSVIIYHNYGQKISLIPDFQYETLIKQNFIKQILDIYVQFESILPVITLQNLYYQRFQPIKTLLTDGCANEEVYVNNLKQIIKLVYKTDKITLQKLEPITKCQDILLWQTNFLPTKQGKTIVQLIQIKNSSPKITAKGVSITQDDLKWIFATAGFADIPKYQLIYNGIENYFDPAPLLKSINKLKVFYFIQNTKGQKIAFFPAVKTEIIPNQLFGTYYPDKQKKSILLGINKRSVHLLQDQGNAVGYGQQILMAIGKLDLIFSAFNGSNISYFPMSYNKDTDICETAQDLLGRQFTLHQFQAYKIS